MPVSPVGGAVRLRYMIGLLDHLTIYLKNRNVDLRYVKFESIFISKLKYQTLSEILGLY